jgi:hypothetical protein
LPDPAPAITGTSMPSGGHPPHQLAASFGLRGSSILVCHLPKSAKQMLIVEFADLEISSAAELYGTSMAKCLPKPLRTLWRDAAAALDSG